MPEVLEHRLLGGRLLLQLLPAAAYSARDPAQWQTLGVTLERQRGVHAIDSDRREDFDTWPGTLALTPKGVEVFSESACGGEYLLARWQEQTPLIPGERRLQSSGHAQALALGREARRLLLAPATDELALEHCALAFVGLSQSRRISTAPLPRLGQVLEQMVDQYAQPLSLAQLALTYGHNELRLLRDFRRAVGMTPHAWLTEVRLQAARRLLERTDLPLAAIAHDSGFAHQSHLGSALRKSLGLTPRQYRLRFHLCLPAPVRYPSRGQ
ncbi:helix-turn-helix transcriptional regulator [Pseudomonas chlororaphis]|uniref:helix-turn-helix domain-containing protein n=1 Tax=Pseudomonas chlororaphis TaxID=587753 RepID=UPI00209BA522|nr:AraC family transcriptional regulator [Pseudomonas chlororaphis]MCO7573943.1 helix-turn-helix transcriptional regulator [Pseudomonas chlororaphis]MCO7592404.1 helix-turn-helix transcriptional regulator [Pseudomonas chlororaphis]